MAGIILSIHPNWVQKIISGEKTIEIRKTAPAVATPFRCLIYMTKERYRGDMAAIALNRNTKHFFDGEQRVVAQFTCYGVERFDLPYPAYWPEYKASYQYILDGSRLSYDDLHRYAGSRPLFAWHIDDLKVFESPKLISDFCRNGNPIKRPPHSWCYCDL